MKSIVSMSIVIQTSLIIACVASHNTPLSTVVCRRTPIVMMSARMCGRVASGRSLLSAAGPRDWISATALTTGYSIQLARHTALQRKLRKALFTK